MYIMVQFTSTRNNFEFYHSKIQKYDPQPHCGIQFILQALADLIGRVKVRNHCDSMMFDSAVFELPIVTLVRTKIELKPGVFRDSTRAKIRYLSVQ